MFETIKSWGQNESECVGNFWEKRCEFGQKLHEYEMIRKMSEIFLLKSFIGNWKKMKYLVKNQRFEN